MKTDKNIIADTEKSELKREKVRIIPIRYIDDFPNHPFKVKDNEEMLSLMESIQMNGVLTPLVVRLKNDGRYELISGHRRKYTCEKLGIDYIPVIVRALSKEEAVIAMVDSNLQREHILPSEKAFAYKMKMDAIRCQGKRNDLTSAPLGKELTTMTSAAKVGQQSGDSANQVHRYIRLTKLIPEILEMVDKERIAFRPAVELSYLAEAEQYDLLETIKSEDCTPSLAQSIRMKKLSQEGQLDMDSIFHIMTEEKGNQKQVYKIAGDKIEKFFSWETTPKEIEDTIIKALEFYRKWERHKERNRDVR